MLVVPTPQLKRATSYARRYDLVVRAVRVPVLDVSLEADGARRVLVESLTEQGGCPGCGVLSGLIRDRPRSRIKDLPHGPVPLHVWVRKRRFPCAEMLSGRRSCTETSAQLPARARLTTRLRTKIGEAVRSTNRAMSEVGKDYGVAWWTVHRVLVAVAADALGPSRSHHHDRDR